MFPQFPQNKEKYCSFCNPKNLQKCGNGLYATWEQQIDNLHLIFIFRHRVFRLTFHTMMSQPTIPQKWPGDSLAHEPITSAPIARHGCQFYVRENCFHEISKANAPGEECRLCSQDFRLQKTRVGSPPTGSFLSLGWKISKQNSLKEIWFPFQHPNHHSLTPLTKWNCCKRCLPCFACNMHISQGSESQETSHCELHEIDIISNCIRWEKISQMKPNNKHRCLWDKNIPKKAQRRRVLYVEFFCGALRWRRWK